MSTPWWVAFLGHGGFKLLLVAFILVRSLMKRKKNPLPKSSPGQRPDSLPTQTSAPTQMKTPNPPSIGRSSPSQSPSPSPWSDGDAFDNKK